MMDKVEMAIKIISLLTAIVGILVFILKVHKWYLKQEQQDTEIKQIKEELRIINMGVLACLDGQVQLGCNHTVPATKKMLEDYINEQAHK